MNFKVAIILSIFILASSAQYSDVVQSQDGRSDFDLPDFDFDKAELLNQAAEFFDFENAGVTKLGKMLAWKGDLIQPVVLFGLGVFTIYACIKIVLTIISGIFDIKVSFVAGIVELLQSLFALLMDKILLIKNPIVEKINAFIGPDADDDTPAAERRRRALDEVAEVVMAALSRHEQKR